MCAEDIQGKDPVTRPTNPKTGHSQVFPRILRHQVDPSCWAVLGRSNSSPPSRSTTNLRSAQVSSSGLSRSSCQLVRRTQVSPAKRVPQPPPPAGFLSMHTFLDPNGSSLLLVHRPGPLVLVLPLAKSWRPTGRAGRPPGPVHPPHRCVGVFGRCLCDEGAAENEVRASTGRVSIEHPPPPPIQSPSSPGPRRTPPKEARRKGHRTWGGGRWGAGAGPCRTVVPEFPKESINIKTAVWDSLGIFGCWICSPGFPKLTTSGRPSSSEPHTELNRLGANAFGPCAPAQKN